ncbi:MAG: hypothetical protein WAN23_07065 [Candidatus Acidiferrales bacterium]
MLVKDLMTTVLVSCTPWDSAARAASLMKAHGIGVVLGIVAQADIALHASAWQVAGTLKEISKPAEPRQEMHFERDCFYCGQPHELDRVLLLNRRRELTRRRELLI